MIYLLIPAYNEAKNLPHVVGEIAAVLTSRPYEIVIVNDGSSDATAQLVPPLAARYPLRLLTHPHNQGVAASFRTGINDVAPRAQPTDAVIIMEGDGTSTATLLPTLADKIAAGADVVIASRYQPGGAYRRFPLKRLVLSRGANFVFRWLFPIPHVRDYSIFYRAYRAKTLQAALATYGDRFITVETFFANIEILLHLIPFAPNIEEIPLVYDYGKKQGKSGMKIGKNLRSYLSFIAAHALRSH